MKKRHNLLTFGFAFLSFCFASGQRKWHTDSIQFSIQTRMVLDSMYADSGSWSTLDFSTIGEASKPSPLFLLYSFLVSAANERELLMLLADKNEKPFIRGYAYMAYLYKCEIEKKPEKLLNYNFNLDVHSGCTIREYTFHEFKEKIHSPRNYCHPNNVFIDEEEKAVIKHENNLRREHGIPLRKDTL